MRPPLANAVARLAVWLGCSRRRPVPHALQLKMSRLRDAVRRGGSGSDLAAAELRGITTTIMALGAQR